MILHFEADSVAIEIPVTRDDGQPLVLMNAQIEAVARMENGRSISIPSQVLNADEGTILIRLTSDEFRAAKYQLQVRVTLGADRQTVVDEVLTVKTSLRAPA